MSYTKEEIEKGLKDSLYNILSDYDQESSIISLKYMRVGLAQLN
jgi:hypothetical protein